MAAGHLMQKIVRATIVGMFGLELLSCDYQSPRERDYNAAVSKNTVQGYEQFLSEYPRSAGPYADSARARLDILHFHYLDSVGTISAYEEYLKKFPRGKSAEAAKGMIEKAFVEERHPAIRNVRVLRLVIEQSIRNAPKVRLDLDGTTGTFLSECRGIVVVPTDAAAFDATLRVKATGHPLARKYTTSISPYVQGEETTLYTGARVSGTISFEKGSDILLSVPFSGAEEPPSQLWDYQVGGEAKSADSRETDWARSPAEAPFDRATEAEGGYLSKLASILTRAFGIGFLRAAVEDKNIDVVTHATKATIEAKAPNSEGILVQAYEVLARSTIADPMRVKCAIIKAFAKSPSAEGKRFLTDNLRYFIQPSTDPWDSYKEALLVETAKALSVAKQDSAVYFLILALKNQDHYPDTRNALAASLRRITGRPYGLAYEKWLSWWQTDRAKSGAVSQ